MLLLTRHKYNIQYNYIDLKQIVKTCNENTFKYVMIDMKNPQNLNLIMVSANLVNFKCDSETRLAILSNNKIE